MVVQLGCGMTYLSYLICAVEHPQTLEVYSTLLQTLTKLDFNSFGSRKCLGPTAPLQSKVQYARIG